MQTIDWHRYPHVAEHAAARAFVTSVAKHHKRPKTVDAYARSLEDLLTTFKGTGPERVLEADAGDMDTYIDLLYERPPKRRGREKVLYITGQKLSPNTIRQRIVVARLFYDFCIRRRLRKDTLNPIPRGRRGDEPGETNQQGKTDRRAQRGPGPHVERLPWTPSDSEWERTVRHVLCHESKRNAAMFLLAYGCALRREELMSLRLADIDWDLRLVTIRGATAKRGRARKVAFSPFVALVLKRYVQTDRQYIIDAFGGDRKGPLFLSESNRTPGKPLHIGAFNDVIEKLREDLDLPQLRPHTLRHQRCTILKRGGMDLDDIALFAGHKSVETTRLYIHMAPTELSKRIAQATAPFDALVLRWIEEAFDGPS